MWLIDHNEARVGGGCAPSCCAHCRNILFDTLFDCQISIWTNKGNAIYVCHWDSYFLLKKENLQLFLGGENSRATPSV